MIIAAPMRFAIERRSCSSSSSPVGCDADLERALLELGDDVPDTPRQTQRAARAA